MVDFARWLAGLGLEKYRDVLAAEDIDLAVAPELSDADLERLGMSLGHRRKFIAAAAQLRPQPAPPTASADRQRVQVERRQITVVFTDLVDSASLANRLDPEDMGRLLAQYREACSSIVGKYDGTIAQFLGDGILAYFGYPQAQEDAAESAVRAALEIVVQVGRLERPDGKPLQARAGIATGLVATSEMAGDGATGEQTVVGQTPNLAARLQALAAPASVIVGPATHRLTRHLFEYQHVGEQAVKGFEEPMAAWRAVSERSTETRFAAARAEGTGPILGRERELAFLADSWERAQRGNGHVVLVAGEAGMGKSKLIEAFAERQRGRPKRLLRCQCSPYHRNTALYPLTQLLKHELALRPDAPAPENVARIEQALPRFGRASRVAKLLLAELLEIQSPDALSAMEMTLAQRKNETLALLEDFLLAAADAAVLLLVEDAHWSDPTTQTLIERLLKRIDAERALVVVTYRPEFSTAWQKHPHASLISCKPLERTQCASLVRRTAAQSRMDEALIEQVVARSDGVPLFAEELTKAVVDLGSFSGSVPLTLQDSLAARLDRLGKAREVAQIASVIGRHFSYPLLATISGESSSDLASALDRLKASGLVLDAGVDDERRYSFNHSLVQEAAYESLARERRQKLHAAIADALATASGESGPAPIAFHLSRAGKPEAAYRQWMQAAQLASQRSAYAESLANLTCALDEAARIDDPVLRLQLTLEAQSQLSAVHVIHDGPASAAAEAALERAYALAKEAQSGPKLFQAVWGLYLNAATKADFDAARGRGDELMSISQQLGDPDLHLEALHHQWGIAYFGGQTQRIIDFARQGIDRYDRARHHALSEVYAGHDPGACAHCCHSLGLGLAGNASAVRAAVDDAIRFADALEHPVTLAFSLGIASHALHLVGDLERCRDYSAQMQKVAERYDFAQQRAFATFMLGLVRSALEDADAGLEQMQGSFGPASTYRFAAGYPQIAMAETLMRAGRSDEALSLVTQVLGAMKTPERGVFVSELWRLRGELELATAADSVSAERCLVTAARIAQEQGAKLFHANALRALAGLRAP